MGASIHEPAFAPPAVLPFPVGTSPFRQKGNGYLGDFAYFDGCIRGGAKAVIAALPDGPVRAFHEQSFRGSDWYDAFPCTLLHAAAARLRGVGYLEHRRQVGAYHANAAAGGIYRALLRVISNENIALWAPRVSSIFFEFGKTETKVIGPREVVALRRGVPSGLVQFVMGASWGFGEQSLKLAGAHATNVELGEPEPDGREHGVELWRIGVTLRWS